MTAFPALEKAAGELNALRKGLKDVFDEAGTDLDMSKVKSISGDKIAWIREQKSQIDKAAEKVTELKEISGYADAMREEHLGADDGQKDRVGGEHATIGSEFVKSLAYKNRGQRAELKSAALFQRASGWTPESTRSGKVVLDAQRPAPHVVEFFPTAPINQAAYKYMEETTYGSVNGTGDAAETSEANPFKESALALTERTNTVEKVTVWLSMTDEQLEDESGAEAYVNSRLTAMMHQRLDLQVLRGDGSTPNLLGTENVVNIQTQAKGTDSLMDATYKLFTNIRETAFSEPNVCFIRPSKWQDVVLAKTADGQYIWGHPSTTGPTTLWGVPVVPTTVVTSTKLVTGDYATHSLLAIKRGIDVQVTNAHSDFFTNGKQAIRMDMRAVVVHFRPEAFGTVTGL